MDKATTRASKGGHARAESLTPEERSESARKAVAARWAKARAIAPSVSMSVGQADSFGNERIQVDVNVTYRVEPLISTGEETWTVNSRSYVTMQKETESFTQ